MTYSFNEHTHAALAVLFAISSISAIAQTPAVPQSPAAGITRGHSDAGGSMHHPDPAKMQAMIAKRQSDLKAKLNITPVQESAWTIYAAAMQPPADLPRRADIQAQRAELDKLPTPERIDKMRALRSERITKMNAEADKRGAAAKSFYAALTPEQRQVFDAEHKSHSKQWNGGLHQHGLADQKKS